MTPHRPTFSESEGDYQTILLLCQELAFDVDFSALACRENGALSLSEMHASGGQIQYNPSRTGFGVGYSGTVPAWTNGTANIELRGA